MKLCRIFRIVIACVTILIVSMSLNFSGVDNEVSEHEKNDSLSGKINFFNFQNTDKNNLADNEKDFWAVVVVALQESLEPYIYNALLAADNWDPSHVKLLWKQEATKEAILNSLSWLSDNANENDTVLFSVDSHGTYHNGVYGIWPSDGTFDGGFITLNELDAGIDDIKAKHMCLIFDCCFSGSFVDNCHTDKINYDNYKVFEQNIRDTFVDSIDDDNRVILMSASNNGLSAHWQNFKIVTGEKIEVSFSSLIGEALTKKTDYNNDYLCSAEEVFQYAKTRWLPYALILAFNPIIQLTTKLLYGFFVNPFPSLRDNYAGELPVVFVQ